MARISKYDSVSAPADTDVFLCNQGGVTKNVLLSLMKAFVIGDINALIYKGAIDCSTSPPPNYPAADAGHVYIVSAAGQIGGASGEVVAAGDMLLCNTDSTPAGDQATVGSKWDIVEKNIDLGNITITGGKISGTEIVPLSASLADEGTITLDTGKTGRGWAMAGDNEEYIEFRFEADGTVTVVQNSANALGANTDGNLCVYDGGSGIVIKNRLGATKTIRYVVSYS